MHTVCIVQRRNNSNFCQLLQGWVLKGVNSGQEEGRKSPSLLGMSNPGSRRSGGKAPGPGKGRSNRGRTVLTEKQRTILSACFQHNPKPDALLKVGAQFRQNQNLQCCAPHDWTQYFQYIFFHLPIVLHVYICLSLEP